MALDFNRTQTELKENEMLILPITAFKTKTGKTCLKYAFPKKTKTDYEKGYAVVMDQWFDNTSVFEKIGSEKFGKEMKVKFEYKVRNNGSAYISITDLCI